jgi:hypothetical protein
MARTAAPKASGTAAEGGRAGAHQQWVFIPTPSSSGKLHKAPRDGELLAPHQQQPHGPGWPGTRSFHVHSFIFDNRRQKLRQQVKASAGKLLDDARDSAQLLANEKKDVAADELHDVAGALRNAAQRRSGDDPLLGLTGSAADGLDRLSNALRNKDVSVMMRDMESFARAQPVAFFGLALATGFLAVRFMKASRA